MPNTRKNTSTTEVGINKILIVHGYIKFNKECQDELCKIRTHIENECPNCKMITTTSTSKDSLDIVV